METVEESSILRPSQLYLMKELSDKGSSTSHLFQLRICFTMIHSVHIMKQEAEDPSFRATLPSRKAHCGGA